MLSRMAHNSATTSLITIVLIAVSLFTLGSTQIHRSQDPKKWQRAKTETDNIVDDSAPDSKYHEESESLQDMAYDVYTVWMYSLLSALLVGLCGVFPLLVIPLEAGPALRHGAGSVRLKLLLSFAVGSLLGDVFLHLLPETWQHTHSTKDHVYVGLWVLTGILFFLSIEKLFGENIENNEKSPKKVIQTHKNSIEKHSNKDQPCAIAESSITTLNNNNKVRKRRTKSGDSKKQSQDGSIKEKENMQPSEPSNKKKRSDKGIQCENNKKNVSKLQSDLHIGEITPHKSESKNKRKKSVQKSENDKVRQSNSDSETQYKQFLEGSQQNVTNNYKHKKHKNEQDTPSISVSGYLNLFANVIDNFTHGLAIGGSYVVSSKLGFVTTFAILIHEIPHEIGDFAILLRSGFNRLKAAKAQIVTACGGMVGVLCALCAESATSAGNTTAWILPFTSGGFLYIALVTVTPDLLQESSLRESLKQIACICLGVASMLLVTMVIG